MEQKRRPRLVRPAMILFQLLLAMVIIVGFGSALASAEAEEQKVSDQSEQDILVPSQFGQGGNNAINNTPVEQKNITGVKEDTQAMIAIGAALAVGIAGIGAATGIGIAGASGIGATAEKPERFGKSLVLQAMPMTQGIYGLLTAILLLMFGGLLGGGGGDLALLSKPIFLPARSDNLGAVRPFNGIGSASAQGLRTSY